MSLVIDPATIADRMAIMEQAYRYCRSVDRLDVPLGHACFHPGSTADFPTYQGSGRGWIDHICEAHKAFLHHSHQVSNVILEIDGDCAGSETYVTACLREMVDGRLIQREFWARYADRWSKRDGGWAIDARVCIVDFASSREIDAIPGDPRAMRDRSDPSYAMLKDT